MGSMYGKYEYNLNMTCLYANCHHQRQEPRSKTMRNVIVRLRDTGRTYPTYQVVDKKDFFDTATSAHNGQQGRFRNFLFLCLTICLP